MPVYVMDKTLNGNAFVMVAGTDVPINHYIGPFENHVEAADWLADYCGTDKGGFVAPDRFEMVEF